MGLLLLPFLFITVIIGMIALVMSIRLLLIKNAGFKDIICGIILSLILFSIIVLVYLIEGEVWALSPAFRLPIFLVFIPFITHLFIKNDNNQKLKSISSPLIICVAFSMLVGLVFNNIIFGLLDFIGVNQYH